MIHIHDRDKTIFLLMNYSNMQQALSKIGKFISEYDCCWQPVIFRPDPIVGSAAKTFKCRINDWL